MKTRLRLILGVAVIVAIGASVLTTTIVFNHKGTSQLPSNKNNNGTPSSIANPTSVYCEDQGGKLKIKKDAKGNEYGWCTLPNGRECEEWDFFRSKNCGSETNTD